MMKGKSKIYIVDGVDFWGHVGSIGLAEHAARTTSLSTFDRRGNFFFGDDFEDAPLKWSMSTDGGGTGESVSLSNERPYSGSGCLKLVQPSANTKYVEASRTVTGVPKSKIGFEVTFNLGQFNGRISMHNVGYTSTRKVYSGIKVCDSNLYVLTSTNPYSSASWQSVATSVLIPTEQANHIKYVVDYDSEKYVRLLFGGNEYDISHITPYCSNNANIRAVILSLAARTNNSANESFYFDNYILTTGEPC